jgi:amino acid transporter
LLYAVIQIVIMGSLPSLGDSSTPMVDAARAFAGSGGATAMATAALVSAFGFCASSALVGPRYVETMATDRFLPSWLEVRSARFGTPARSVVTISVVVAVLAVFLDFTSLADTSNIAVVVQYLSTCVAIVIMRRREPNATGFRTPFGILVPGLAILGSVAFLIQVGARETLLATGLLGGGMLIGLVSRRVRPENA